ncbi:hypothetical protein [Polynucleobacter sp. UK-FUSCHL-C3]|uniref:Uncharacterized protein n=1 Tax=Polynucleobacter sp. UK-FUSCHL-C3 TaxID=2955208 RepID=A0AAU8A3M6_9BURK
MKILILYNESQTYTQTVFEHLDAFRKFSQNKFYYLHYENLAKEKESLEYFQIIFLHYSVRLPADQISEAMGETLSQYRGAKVLFIQDEYDKVARTKYWIKKIKFDIVFSVVPKISISIIYPKEEFSNTKFVNNLTGYVPENLNSFSKWVKVPPSSRSIEIGYRGRHLPIKYGDLAREKVRIGVSVKQYCKLNNIVHDIEWDEQSRIYGDNWYKFIANCKSMLGSESGSNVFDWDGNLDQAIKKYRKLNSSMSEDEIYENFIQTLERPGLMNQISPRIFEMAAAGTIMILYEGTYSNVIEPNRHFLSLKKDHSNLPEIIAKLRDGDFIDEMASRVKTDIIETGKYSYQQFVSMIDLELSELSTKDSLSPITSSVTLSGNFSKDPVRVPALFHGSADSWIMGNLSFALKIWPYIPLLARTPIKKIIRKMYF